MTPMIPRRVAQFLSDAKAKRWTRPAVVATVVAAHVGVLAAIGLSRAAPPSIPLQLPISVELFEIAPPPPPPPPPDPEPAADPGGGAPAAASRVNRPPDPPRVRPELPVLPPTPAPEPTLVVGASPTATLNTGLGQGGEGTGTGAGTGEGDGPGSGTRALILRGASNIDILPYVPPEARRRRIPGRAEVRCVIRADTRLESCRISSESPEGLGFGASAVRIAETYYRVRPATTASGQVVEGGQITVGVLFGRQ